MSLERELEKLVQLKQMERCEKCQHPLHYIGSGRYRCSFCGAETLDDFGKIKQFLDQNGPTPSGIIAQQTGLSMDKIDAYLRKGMVEIQDGGKYYLSCEKCGCAIRYGRYCPECAKHDIKSGGRTSYQDVGERPKQQNAESAGKMRFINRKG